MRLFVPFGGPRQKFAIAVAAGDVGKHDGRQCAGVMQPFAPPVDVTFVGQFAQHAIEGAPGRRSWRRTRGRFRAFPPCRSARG